MLFMQANPETNSKAKAFRKYLTETISDAKHSPTMTRMGAILGKGIIDAGGRNVTIELMSRSGFTKPPAIVGMVLWTQYWYWYPMLHMISLSFTPTALIGVNHQLDLPRSFSVDCARDLKYFDYPKPLEEKKEKKQVRVKTAVLSMTAKAKARAALKRKESNPNMDVDDDDADGGNDKMEEDEDKTGNKAAKAKEANAPEEEPEARITLENPLRVVRAQSKYIRFKTDRSQRYTPVCRDVSHRTGIIVLQDHSPDEEEDVIKVAVPVGGDDAEEDAPPPEPFEWEAPN